LDAASARGAVPVSPAMAVSAAMGFFNSISTCRTGLLELWRPRIKRIALLRQGAIVGGAVAALSCLVDRTMYGRHEKPDLKSRT